MNHNLRSLASAAVGVSCLFSPTGAAAQQKSKGKEPARKNVIWIMSDQHRAQAMHHRGDPNARTPRMDALAGESVAFADAYSTCPWSAPFRGSLLTGRFPNNALIKTPQHLDKEIPLVSDVFNDAGYLTAYYGKWHVYGANNRAFVPKDERGRFAIWLAYENNNAPFDSWVHGHDIWGRDDKTADAEKLSKYETDALTDKVIEFLDKRPKNRPFFLILSVQPPHDPFVAPDEYMKHFDRDALVLRPNVPDIDSIRQQARKDLAGYYAQIENLDDNIGRLYEACKERGLLDDTHFFYFSDHGDCQQSHGYIRKSSPWEESIRIPCIIRPAGRKSTGKVAKAMITQVDLAPTTIGLCGIEVPTWLQGYDLSGHIASNGKADTPDPDAVLLQHVFPKTFACLDRPWRGVVTRDGWKFVVVEHQPIMLFNLNDDPYELFNMVYLPQYKKKKAELAEILRKLLAKAGDQFEVTI